MSSKSLAAIGIATAGIVLAGVIGWAAKGWVKQKAAFSPYNTDNAIWQVTFGDDVLNIPLNHVREAPADLPKAATRVRLIFLWPEGNGYSERDSARFTQENERSLIFAELGKRDMNLDMSGRLPGVYLQLFDGLPTPGPATLQIQTLRPGSGYGNEELAIGGHGTWVARCEPAESAGSTRRPSCLRDIHMGESFSVRYRFDRSLLAHWEALEAMVKGKVDEFLSASDLER